MLYYQTVHRRPGVLPEGGPVHVKAFQAEVSAPSRWAAQAAPARRHRQHHQYHGGSPEHLHPPVPCRSARAQRDDPGRAGADDGGWVAGFSYRASESSRESLVTEFLTALGAVRAVTSPQEPLAILPGELSVSVYLP